MLRNRALFLLCFLAPHIDIFRVCLRQIVETEPLGEAHFGAAVVVALHHRLEPPLRICWTLAMPAPEKLLVFDLQPADILLDLSYFFVDSGHS